MTINKAQGHTFQRVGIFLPQPCFSDGQLYVDMSRVDSLDAVIILALPELGANTAAGGDECTAATPNVVYREVLQR
jgi:ATP-dependent DNA helicase PIF1